VAEPASEPDLKQQVTVNQPLLCTRYIGLATQARWSSSQTTRLPQARSQLHETWHTKYYAEQVRPL